MPFGHDDDAEADYLYESNLTWEHLSFVRTHAPGLPVLVKGILTAEDATIAVEHGVEAIVVSNHGGRQLDSCPASLDALPEVVEAVGRAGPGPDGRRRASRDRRGQGTRVGRCRGPRRPAGRVGSRGGGRGRRGRGARRSSAPRSRTRWRSRAAARSRRSIASSSSAPLDVARGRPRSLSDSLQAMPGYDLHSHSNRSDGTLTPSEVMQPRAREGPRGRRLDRSRHVRRARRSVGGGGRARTRVRAGHRVLGRVRGREPPHPRVLGRPGRPGDRRGAPAAHGHEVPARRDDRREAPRARPRHLARPRPGARRGRRDRAAAHRGGHGRGGDRGGREGGVRALHLRRRSRVRAEARPASVGRSPVDRRRRRRLRARASRDVARDRHRARRVDRGDGRRRDGRTRGVPSGSRRGAPSRSTRPSRSGWIWWRSLPRIATGSDTAAGWARSAPTPRPSRS